MLELSRVPVEILLRNKGKQQEVEMRVKHN